jgi:hypothetical protein
LSFSDTSDTCNGVGEGISDNFAQFSQRARDFRRRAVSTTTRAINVKIAYNTSFYTDCALSV